MKELFSWHSTLKHEDAFPAWSSDDSGRESEPERRTLGGNRGQTVVYVRDHSSTVKLQRAPHIVQNRKEARLRAPTSGHALGPVCGLSAFFHS